jgi:high-affinity iron transporter
MFETMTIAFREGMEAFLIVAISLAYLVRTGRPQLKKPVFYGIGFAVVASTILGVWLKNVSDNPLTEGLLAVVAGLLVGTFTVHMIRVAKTMGREIRETLELHANKTGFWASFGVFAFVSLMITREGMETVLMMSAVSYQTTALEMYSGVVAGLGLAGLMGYFWVKKSHLINISRFLQVSSIFLVIFSFHLFLYGLHELSETGMVPLLDNGVFHEITEVASHDSIVSQIIMYSLVVVPLGWLGFVTIKDKFLSQSEPV